MKFNCGLTKEEKERAKMRAEIAAHDRLLKWHDYFALCPIQVASGDCRWLETVERKGDWRGYLYGGWEWQYRAKEGAK
jgi:hypothetical protein